MKFEAYLLGLFFGLCVGYTVHMWVVGGSVGHHEKRVDETDTVKLFKEPYLKRDYK